MAISLTISVGMVNSQCAPEFRPASYYASNMVLQRPPARPRIWGYAASVGQQVIVDIPTASQTLMLGTTMGPEGRPIWDAVFQPITATGPHTIVIQQGPTCVITLTNVLIGDVWVCSGQSNMQFAMNQVNDTVAELQDVVNYPNVRSFFANFEWDDTPLYDLKGIVRNWAEPTPGNMASFSAICWMFGRNLHRKYGVPIGLIETNWGGTRIEAWTETNTLSQCFSTVSPADPPNRASVLYNAMIHPFLRMPIYGATWYQGESNTGNSNLYACALKAMVGEWRSSWKTSNPEMDGTFPFGVVQLAPWRNDPNLVGGFSDIRWAQTDGFGFCPNNNMEKFFLAVALDLPDFGGDEIHPRYKRQIADRLSLAAYYVAYGSLDVGLFQGPQPVGFSINAGGDIHVVYSANFNIVAPSNYFELCCGPTQGATCTGAGGRWVSTSPSADNSNNTYDLRLVNACNTGESVTGFRYLWRESPCQLLQCPLYSVENDLPAPPFIYHGHIARG